MIKTDTFFNYLQFVQLVLTYKLNSKLVGPLLITVLKFK
jgi:hypothetical protein